MRGQTTRAILGVLLLSGLLVGASRAESREVVNLDGIWDFATDPDNRGEAGRWYAADVALPAMPLPGYARAARGKIRVPGIWDNQGYGTETEKVRHNFVGKGWYKRQVEIPAGWDGRRVFLAITGSSRYAKLWVNGQFVGEHIGYVSPAEFEITRHLTAGRSTTIAIQVDSQQRWDVDSLYGCAAMADFMDVPWGGIWGHVVLEARSRAWFADLCVRPDVNGSACVASATVNGEPAMADRATLEVFDQGGQRVAESTIALDGKLASGGTISAKAAIPGAKLWTPDTPVLYKARLSLAKGPEVIDSIESRFGMREFKTDGYRLLLNGKRLMLRGYGDDHIYLDEMALPSDKELHLRRLRLVKSYGFNHVRHHSTIMPPEYYDACDEVGILATCEFPIVYWQYVPGVGDVWKKHVEPGTEPGPAVNTYRREWTAAIKQLRNHPSILSWVMGNELGQNDNQPKPVLLFAGIARQYDPTRFFMDSDGVSPDVFDPKNDRSTLDLYLVQFNEGSNPIDNPAKFHTPEPKKPTLSHEAGNYVTFSRPSLADEFQGNFKPFWMTAGKSKLEKLGLLGEADNWARASERLYALCHKCNLEALRKNPYLSGYHWWLFQDYWTSSNGLVDFTFRPKSITPTEVLQINNDVVLLQDGLQQTYRGKSSLKLTLWASNYSWDAIDGRLAWELKTADGSLAKEECAVQGVAQGSLAEATSIGIDLPDPTKPVELILTASLAAGAKEYRNQWSAWLYPSVIGLKRLPLPLFADGAGLAHCGEWGAKPLPEEGELTSQAVYVVGWLDPRLVAAMERGAKVVLLEGALEFSRTRRVSFRTSWWKAGDSYDANHCGTYVYDHPITRTTAPDGWCDIGWFSLVDGAEKCVLENAPSRPKVIIRALPALAAVEDDALLYEVGVGQGHLIVSGLNHAQAKGQPENQWLLAQMIEHAANGPAPEAVWSAATLAGTEAAPEGCLVGFRRVVGNQGEDTTWYSYREDNVRMFVCRQTEPGHRLTWETAASPKRLQGDGQTFVFAGGLGYSTEPKTTGFVLEVDGKETLRFDLPEPSQWESADKRVQLRFESRRVIGPDRFGLFHLTVPNDLVAPGKRLRIGVRSIGEGSRRWFGLTPYADVR